MWRLQIHTHSIPPEADPWVSGAQEMSVPYDVVLSRLLLSSVVADALFTEQRHLLRLWRLICEELSKTHRHYGSSTGPFFSRTDPASVSFRQPLDTRRLWGRGVAAKW
jgi:hypothetical protein